MERPNPWQNDVEACVRAALAEDIGSGDITAELIPADRHATARVKWPSSAARPGSMRFSAKSTHA
jgi:nicotinate-nucleotide pyrophosphorylase (carboxylating)